MAKWYGYPIKFGGVTVLLGYLRLGYKRVGVHCKKTETDDKMIKKFLLHKDKENGNPPHIQASRFLSGATPRTGDRFAAQKPVPIYREAFFLPAHH